MFTGVYQSAAILAVTTLYYTLDIWLMRRYNPLRKRSSRNWVYTVATLIGMLLMSMQPIVLPELGLRVSAWWGLLAQLLGVISAIGALILHWWARIHLKQFFYEGVELQPGHRLVDTGPYTYVRHPIYTSTFMLAIGVLLISPSLPTLAGIVYAFAVFIPMSAQEEKLLLANVPGYAEYMTHTSRFLPGLCKHSGEK